MLPILVMDILMPLVLTVMLLMFLLDPALVLTQSLRVLTLLPRELFLIMVLVMLVTIMESDLLMLNLRLMLPILVMDILIPMEFMDMLLTFLLDPAPVLTQSPKVLTL